MMNQKKAPKGLNFQFNIKSEHILLKKIKNYIFKSLLKRHLLLVAWPFHLSAALPKRLRL